VKLIEIYFEIFSLYFCTTKKVKLLFFLFELTNNSNFSEVLTYLNKLAIFWFLPCNLKFNWFKWSVTSVRKSQLTLKIIALQCFLNFNILMKPLSIFTIAGIPFVISMNIFWNKYTFWVLLLLLLLRFYMCHFSFCYSIHFVF